MTAPAALHAVARALRLAAAGHSDRTHTASPFGRLLILAQPYGTDGVALLVSGAGQSWALNADSAEAEQLARALDRLAQSLKAPS